MGTKRQNAVESSLLMGAKIGVYNPTCWNEKESGTGVRAPDPNSLFGPLGSAGGYFTASHGG